ncbi:MAG: hypothetical protein GY810_12110 [Aureispira sp.]|nr:hypothetical protein [Aureispira sp.]
MLDFIGELLGGGKAGKPIIYFYPEKETEVHVQLNYGGKLTTTYPKYDAAKGWNATIKPNGTLIDLTTQKEYYALYWEGIGLCQFDLSTGFVVKGENVADFLDEKLEQLGLTRREANEFIVYWLPELEVNEYNLIHFAQEKYRDFAKLEISPKPETLIRVFMVYKTLSKSINIQEQVLPAKVERKGFTVVEWGGTKVKNTFSDFVK